MTHFANHVSKALNEKEHTIAIFCDLRKAFDSCNHQILLCKLSRLGIRGGPLAWFANYLSERSQFVCVNGVDSSLLTILMGTFLFVPSFWPYCSLMILPFLLLVPTCLISYNL
jgi:hypothetical protein